MKNLTDFRKTVETGVDPRLLSEAFCEAIDMKMFFYSHANQTPFHKRGFALSLILKMNVLGMRK